MFPAKIKAFYLSPTFGIALCVLAIFLIANVFYLNSVRDTKADAMDTLSSSLGDFETALQRGSGKSGGNLPEQAFRYGALLKPVSQAFKNAGKDITIQGIHLTEEEAIVLEVSENKHANKNKNKASEKLPLLRISGVINHATQTEPYAQLNEVMEAIHTETHCQFSLQKAGWEEMTQEAETFSAQPTTFEIALQPTRQPECLKQYRRGER